MKSLVHPTALMPLGRSSQFNNQTFIKISQEKKIGHEYALFYEAYGTYYELKGNSSAADAVYNEGINRCGVSQNDF